MIFDFRCLCCGFEFESNNFKNFAEETYTVCPKCGKYAQKQFHACVNMYVPSYFHTSKSDIFTDTEWADLKKDPNIERA